MFTIISKLRSGKERQRNETIQSNGFWSLDPLIPPSKLNYNQAEAKSLEEYEREYKYEACLKQLPFLIHRANLKPHSTMLDFGCGLGRHAFAASKYLSPEGSYYGHDINENAISFLQNAYVALPNFFFHCTPLAKQENYIAIKQNCDDLATARATQIDLAPFVQKPIDVQWSSSVFTHMWPDAITKILRNIGMLLAPNGTCVNTWLMIDDFVAYILKCDMADRKLPYRVGEAWTYTKENPLMCTAYEETTIRRIYAEAGHEIIDILPGSWAGRENGVTYQDIIISRIR